MVPAAANQQAPERQTPLTARKTYSKSGVLGRQAAGLEANLVFLGFHKLHLSLALAAAGAQQEHNVGGVNLGDLSERWNLLTPDCSDDMQ